MCLINYLANILTEEVLVKRDSKIHNRRLFAPAEPLTAIWRALWRTKNDI